MKMIKKITNIFLAIPTLILLNATEVTHATEFNTTPRPMPAPGLGIDGASTLHGDAAASDTSPFSGPGQGKLISKKSFLGAACPTLLQRSDGHFMVLCTGLLSRAPTVFLINKDNGRTLANIKLEAGELLGGVYAYLDNQDRIIMADGNNNLIRVFAYQDGDKQNSWRLEAEITSGLTSELDKYCIASDLPNNCDGVVSLSPGRENTIWFATRRGIIGILNTESASTASLQLGNEEEIHNAFSTTADGRAAVVTDHALYLLADYNNASPNLLWRHTYERGNGRKPGQLSYGSGATPTFFGPDTGTDYVTITDNASDQISLVIRDASIEGNGDLICEKTLFSSGKSGTENSAIGIGNTVFVASTYGYPYPAPALADAGPALEETTDFFGGMVRIDVDTEENYCTEIWSNSFRSAAVPKLSTKDGLIYTVERRSPERNETTTVFDRYYFTAINASSGEIVNQKRIGWGPLDDTLQTAGNISSEDGVFWQGRIGGFTRIIPK